MPLTRRSFLKHTVLAGYSLLVNAPRGAYPRQANLSHRSGIEGFLGEPFCEIRTLFEGDPPVREPYLAAASDGTLLAIRNYVGHMRRSPDGGETWSDIFETPIRHSDSNLILDEKTGDLISLRLWDGNDRLFRTSDGGVTWREEPIELRLNGELRWLKQSGLKTRTSRDNGRPGETYYLHCNASEPGVTLQRGKWPGRLIVTGTFRPHAAEHPSDRKPVDAIYSCAFYSDDRGRTWKMSELFPDGYTEEAALVELHDGRIYYNTRSHRGFYARERARKLSPEHALRRDAWSLDGGHTWEDFRISPVLPDGGGYNRGYGMKGGLARLPLADRDVLIYTNADTAGGPREKLTVWASFDGGRTWPVKRLLYPGPAAYSSLVVGRPGTPGQGKIFALFEGSPRHPYGAMQIARFNLAWVLQGEPTGDGTLPDWLVRD